MHVCSQVEGFRLYPFQTCQSRVLLFLVTTSPCWDWVICMPAMDLPWMQQPFLRLPLWNQTLILHHPLAPWWAFIVPSKVNRADISMKHHQLYGRAIQGVILRHRSTRQACVGLQSNKNAPSRSWCTYQLQNYFGCPSSKVPSKKLQLISGLIQGPSRLQIQVLNSIFSIRSPSK